MFTLRQVLILEIYLDSLASIVRFTDDKQSRMDFLIRELQRSRDVLDLATRVSRNRTNIGQLILPRSQYVKIVDAIHKLYAEMLFGRHDLYREMLTPAATRIMDKLVQFQEEQYLEIYANFI